MKTAVELWSEIKGRSIITGWSGRRNHQMTTTLQVEQAVNYRVSLKAAKTENQRTKTENRDEPASCLQQQKTSNRDECLGWLGGAERGVQTGSARVACMMNGRIKPGQIGRGTG